MAIKTTIKRGPTVTVQQMLASLAGMNPDAEVRVWLPGSRIRLSMNCFANTEEGKTPEVLFEGNVEEGSVLEQS